MEARELVAAKTPAAKLMFVPARLAARPALRVLEEVRDLPSSRNDTKRGRNGHGRAARMNSGGRSGAAHGGEDEGRMTNGFVLQFVILSKQRRDG